MINAVTPTDSWADRAFLRDVQYRTDVNLATRQSIYAYQHPHIDLPARVLDLAGLENATTIADIGCGNGAYLAELARRGFAGRVFGGDLSTGMLAATRQRLSAQPSSESARQVALVAADAMALPIRDAMADVTLAMHMLYHVPDPSVALRELRRVTRPGGRVVIGLNGKGHMGQLREILAAARGDDPASLRERLTLDDGETLARTYFASVTRHDFTAELRIPGTAPIKDYLRSMSGTKHAADSDRLVAAVLDALPSTADGHRLLTTHAGSLICSG